MSVASVKATINGQEYDLQWDESSSSYKATISAPSLSSYNETGHYYPVTIKATDDGGNVSEVDDTDETFGEYLKLQVKERVKPVSTITYPTTGSHISSNTPLIKWTVTDNDSGVDPDTIKIQIGSGPAITEGITKTPNGSKGYDCSYTPSILEDGEHTIIVEASDYDGNIANAAGSHFVVDTVPPVLVVNSPTEGLVTNSSTVIVSGTTNDVTSGTPTLTVNDVPVTVGEDGAFSYEYTLTEGANVITIKAIDAAGKVATVVRNVTLDTGSPVFHEISIVPNPVDAGQTYIITVKVTD